MTVPAPLARLVAVLGEHAPLLLAETAAMTRFFSRLPLPRLGKADDPAAPPPFARALRMLPLASLLIAAPAALVAALLASSPLSSLAAAAVTVTAMTLATGAFHEDGLADVSDAFAGGRDAVRRLEIMKDSRIGAHGAMALWVLLTVRWSALCALDRRSLWALPLAMVWGRWSISVVAGLLPAVSQGLAKEVGGGMGWISFLGASVLLAAMNAACWHRPGLLQAAIAAVVTVLVWAAYLKNRLGGHSGDLLGAGNQLVEAAVLLALVAR